MRKIFAIAAAALFLINTSVAHGQTVTKGNTATETATITGLDATRKYITLKSDTGEEDTFDASILKRFDELKVGQKIKVTYYESMVFQVVKPGQAASPASVEASLNRAKSALPAGTVATQQKMTVTVKSIDTKVPSLTVTTPDGRVVTRHIEDRKNIEGLKVGDRIDITYTQALLASVENAK
jgi:hypothetical protein